MKKFVIAGTLVGALALGATAFAQSSTPAKQPAKPAASTAAEQPAGQTADQPGAKKKSTMKKAAAGDSNAAGTHTAPKAQPNTTGDATAPGAMALGSVHIPAGVKADGKELPAGTYQVRLTADEA